MTRTGAGSSAQKYRKGQQFALTALDRELMPRCIDDIDLWLQGYFDGHALRYQRYFYHAPQKHKMLIAGIRTGKSRLASMGFLHFAQFHPYTRLLNTSISSEQAKIVFTNCLEYCNAPRWKHWVERIQTSPYPLIRLVNGAELWFRSLGYEGEMLRGFEFDFINFDEAAYSVRRTGYDMLRGRLMGYNSLTGQPRYGIMWIISSPKGQGWIADLWKKGDPQYALAEPSRYLSLRATIFDNPYLDKELLADIMKDYTENMIRQELYGEFLDNLDAVFPYGSIMACCEPEDPDVKQLVAQIEAWKHRNRQKKYDDLTGQADLAQEIIRLANEGLTDIAHYELAPQPGHRYISSWDLGKKPTGKGRNAMVGQVWDITHEPWTLVAYKYSETMGYVEAKGWIESWHTLYNRNGASCRSVIDSTGKGDVLQEFIEREQTVDDLEGIVYSSANKPNLIHAGKLAIERGLVRFPFIQRMVDQLTNYELNDRDLAQDIVMAFCQAMYAAREATRISGKDDSYGTLQQRLNMLHQYTYGAGAAHRQARLRMNSRYIASRRERHRQRTQHIVRTRI